MKLSVFIFILLVLFLFSYVGFFHWQNQNLICIFDSSNFCRLSVVTGQRVIHYCQCVI